MATTILCPGQGAQAVGMGQAWRDEFPAAAAVFDQADEILSDTLPAPLSTLCFQGPVEVLTQTNVSQPAIYTCSVACCRGLMEKHGEFEPEATAGLSLGEYTALHLAGAFSFEDGLKLVALRGKLMQEAAEASAGSMVALMGADEDQANKLCDAARGDDILVTANFNAPGQIVLSGSASACERAVQVAGDLELRATPLQVAGAFHSPLMDPATGPMAEALAATTFDLPRCPVMSNVTGKPHEPENVELMRQRLVEQIVNPVRWAQCCQSLVQLDRIESVWELAPGSVLRGLMRRIDRNVKVKSHDKPELVAA